MSSTSGTSPGRPAAAAAVSLRPRMPPPSHFPSHPPFKLRFASPRPLGRSQIAAHRPLALLTGKFYARSPPRDETMLAREQLAERRVHRLFADQPSDKYLLPLTTQHEYGWYLNEEDIVKLRQWQSTDPACLLMKHPIREILNKI